VERKPLTSGEQYDDGDPTSYYEHLCNTMYLQQAGKLLKKINQYMKAFY
jgi:hypothetical protein